MNNEKVFRSNNFDLIRLIAAVEVAITHSVSHLNVDGYAGLLYFLHFIPGVPIFFFVSGFLISKSFENSLSLSEYSLNRFVRIFPGLIFVSIMGIFAVYLTGYLSTQNVSFEEIFVWFLAQISIVQFYNPEFMRSFGVGVLNGSLWTICVELQFYVLIPILYKIFKVLNNIKSDKILYMLIAISLIIHFTYYEYNSMYKDVFLFKLLGVTFIPWLYMFLMGVLFQRNFKKIYKLLKDNLIYLLVAYVLIVWIIEPRMGNGINPIVFICLAALVFSIAYNYSFLSNYILKRNDISYGIYIYHMIFVNLFLYYSFSKNIIFVLLIVLSTIIVAILSWLFLEKPFLKLKYTTIRNVK